MKIKKNEKIIKEDSHINLEHPYALSKYLGEKAVFHWNKVYGLSANSIRIFNAYGPRVRTTGAYGAVIGVFLKQKINIGGDEETRSGTICSLKQAVENPGLGSDCPTVCTLSSASLRRCSAR